NEIVAMRPDVVVSRSTPATTAIRNRGVPIVFVLVTDPKGSGFVQDLGRPGDNITGFSALEYDRQNQRRGERYPESQPNRLTSRLVGQKSDCHKLLEADTAPQARQ